MVVDLPVMCAACGHPYWLALVPLEEGGPAWELTDQDGLLVAEDWGCEPACPLCGGSLVEDPLADLEA